MKESTLVRSGEIIVVNFKLYFTWQGDVKKTL